MGIGNMFSWKSKEKEFKKTGNSKSTPVKKYKMKQYQLKEWERRGELIDLPENIIRDKNVFTKTYFDALHRYVPSVSGAIWTWSKLCNTPFEMKFVGGTKKQRDEAKIIYDNLVKRLNPMKMVKNGGTAQLFSIYYEHLFKYGRTSGSFSVFDDLSGIKKFDFYNPYKIRFQEETLDPILIENGKYFGINEASFYYIAQSMDEQNPYGMSMLEATPSLINILNDMMIDMANSSSNAGVPRLHVGVEQPKILPKETTADYITRSNKYFDDTVDNLSTIGSDQNFYTWSDVSIGLTGGAQGASGYVWGANRQVVDEEVITAFHLFPWVLAKSFGSTKNYVQVQFDLLMTEVDSIQADGANFMEWLTQVEFNLKGITNVKPVGHFQRLRDPAVKNIAVAERFQIDNVLTKVQNGVISPDDGARALGEDKAFAADLMLKKENAPKPKTRVDESEQPVDKKDNPEKSPDKKENEDDGSQ